MSPSVPEDAPPHTAAPEARRDPRLRVLTVGNLVFAAAIVVMLFHQLGRERDIVVENARSDAALSSEVLAEQTGQLFASADLALASLNSVLDHHEKDQAELREMLSAIARDLPAVDTLLVLNADGRLRASSRTYWTGTRDFSADPVFAVHAADRSRGVYLSGPVLERAEDAEYRWLIYVSRPLRDAEGRFLGVAAAAISVTRIAQFYDSLPLGVRGVAALVRDDGELLTRSPFSADMIGQKVPEAVLARQRETGATAQDAATLAEDGTDQRLFASASLPNAPAFVYVSLSVPERLAPWRRDLILDAGVGLLALLAFAGFTIALRRRIQLDERHRQQHVAQLQRLTSLSVSLMKCTDVQSALDVAVGQARTLVPCEAARITLAPGMGSFGGRIAQSVGPLGPEAGAPGSAAAPGHAPFSRADAIQAFPSAPSMLRVPLTGPEGERLGLIEVWGRSGQTRTNEQLALLQRLSHITSLTIQRIKMSEEATCLKEQADRASAAAEEARTTEAKLRWQLENILISIRDAVFSLDQGWRFIYLNPRAEEYLEQNSSDVIGHSIWDVLPEVVGTTLHENFVKAVEEQTDVNFEFFFAPLERWFDVRAFPQNEGGITVYFQDISNLIAKEEQLKQAQKMEVVGHLTGGVAHDFNNLLTVIIGNTEMVLDDAEEGSRTHRLLSMTSKAADQAAELTQRLLAFSRRQPLSPRDVDVKALLDELAPLLQRTIGEQYEMAITAPDSVATAMIDSTQLENAIINLVLNARDAMPDGGTISISVSETSVGEGTPDLRLDTDPGRYVMITISDTGMGMSEKVRSCAFDPFFTTKDVGRGSGLGLSMVFGFVKQSGGNVRIDSEVGQGTAVRMYLPISDGKTEAKPRTVKQVTAWRGTENILIVEDDSLVRGYARSTLLSLGYAVTAVADADAALEALKGSDEFDLVICDVILGGSMNGPQFAELALARKPDLKVLYMSGYAERVIYEQKHLDPAANLLTKPFRRADLSARVREILAAG